MADNTFTVQEPVYRQVRPGVQQLVHARGDVLTREQAEQAGLVSNKAQTTKAGEDKQSRRGRAANKARSTRTGEE
jgi:hypothetical protein